jgi:hypothetical protein
MSTRQLIPMQPAPQIPTLSRVSNSLLQRKCDCGGSPGPTGECENCKKERLQRKTRDPISETRNSPSVPPVVHEVLRSPGQPLGTQTRAFFEPRFGHDFSRVQVHSDARAAESAHAVNAAAYAVGHHVVFGTRQYAPLTLPGLRLLAHELAHVVQQHKDDAAVGQVTELGASDNRYEQEADLTAAQIVRGDLPSKPSQIHMPAVQRTMICSKTLEFKLAGLFGARHSYIDDTGRDDCLGSGQVGQYAVTDLVSGNFVRGCAAKTDRSPDPRGKTPLLKPCKPKSGVTDLSRCLRDAYSRYADPSVYSNEAVTVGAGGGALVGGAAGAIGGAAVGSLLGPVGTIAGGIIGGVAGLVGGAVGGARLTSKVNGPNSNTFAATLATSCCEDATSSGLGWVPGWEHRPAPPCAQSGKLVA